MEGDVDCNQESTRFATVKDEPADCHELMGLILMIRAARYLPYATLALAMGLDVASMAPVAEAAEITADTSKPQISTYSRGEPAFINFSILNLNPHQTVVLEVSIRDEFGELRSKAQSFSLTADASGVSHISVNTPTSQYGYYEVHAQLEDGTTTIALGTRPSGLITYAVVVDPLSRVDYGDSLSRFGLQGGFNASANVIGYLGARYMIGGGGGWSTLEEHYPGEYRAERDLAAKNGLPFPSKDPATNAPNFNGRVWTTYFLTTISNAALPDWAVDHATAGTICKNFSALNSLGAGRLSGFSKALAKDFSAEYPSQTRRYYQVTWEPASGWCFRGSAADIVQTYALVYDAVHSVDSRAGIAGPTLFPDDESTLQLRELWRTGLVRYIDALSIHPYVKWPPEDQGRLIDHLRQQLSEAEIAAGHRVPFIGTEHGYKSAELGDLKKAFGDIRTTILMLGEGAEFDLGFYIADFWDGRDPRANAGYGFYWNLNSKIVYGTDKIGPKPVAPAYAAMTYFLDGSVTDGPLTNLGKTQVGYRFHRNGNFVILVVWDYAGPSKYRAPAGGLLCDWMGNCASRILSGAEISLGPAPIYIVSAVQ